MGPNRWLTSIFYVLRWRILAHKSDNRDARLTAQVPVELGGQRLDRILAELFPDFSRSRLQQMNQRGDVLVDGAQRRDREKLLGGERVELHVEQQVETETIAQDLPLTVVYEDDTIIVLNKNAGEVVHPAAGNPDGTLQNALLFHYPELREVPRAGIVHRLDKDTTGLLVVARTVGAHTSLVAQLQARSVKREYLALVQANVVSGGKIDKPIARHPTDRKRMSVYVGGKEAITHYRVDESFDGFTLLRVRLETGRTHQIRVHMSALRWPLVGDATYGFRLRLPKHASAELVDALRGFSRQALHAHRLALVHPVRKETMEWEVPLPEDFEDLLDALRGDQWVEDADDLEADDDFGEYVRLGAAGGRARRLYRSSRWRQCAAV